MAINPIDLVEPACPLCGSDKRRLCLRLGPAWVAACRACGLRYAFPRLQGAFLTDAYADNPSHLPPERDAMLTHLMQARARQVLAEAWPIQGKRWLELGCGFGHCLAAIRDAGFDVEGIELSREQMHHAREKLGLKVEARDILQSHMPGTYDVIASFEVIEHMTDPMAFLQWAFAHLNPGGQIILSTPNYASLYRRYLRRHWYYHIPTQHLTYFTATDLRRALQRTGFHSMRTFTSGRSLFSEKGNAHNSHRPEMSLARQWQENAIERGRIEDARESHSLTPPRGLGPMLKQAAEWRLGQWAGKVGWGDQLRMYALKPEIT